MGKGAKKPKTVELSALEKQKMAVPTYEEQGEPVSRAARDTEAAKLQAMRGAAGTILTSLYVLGSGKESLGASGNRQKQVASWMNSGSSKLGA